ncbi:MAG: ATP-binding protein [Bacteroidota bacterium]|nr:ATP-binding protein [Bacteroidota bacterium]
MTFQELKSLVIKGESEFLEFKRKIAHPEKIVKEVVAFANSKGGLLLIGVDDNGTLPGLKFADEEQFVLEEALQKYCKPKINYSSETIYLSKKKSIICYTIFESQQKPHYVIEDFAANWGKAYVRVADKSVQASREMREIMKRSRKKKDIKFNFGEKERMLMSYLAGNTEITLQQFQDLAGISRFVASKTLIILVLANVLKINPNEKEDIYLLKSRN